MCGRFASSLPPDEIRRVFATLGETPNLAPSWNVAPTQPALVVRRHPETGERRLDALVWGFVAWHEKDPKGGRRPINARAETIATSGTFRAAFQARRCLVPMDAFYEWEATATGKQPWAFGRTDGAKLALAGVWESWRAPDGEVRRSFAIATTAANGLMGRIHDRMPVVVEAASWGVWLGEAAGDARALLRPAGEDVLRSWPVSRDVNSPRHDRADLLARVAPPDGRAGPAEKRAPPVGDASG